MVLRQGGDLAQVETFYSPQDSEEEEEEEEGLLKADAVNEEDPERDRATPAVRGGCAPRRGRWVKRACESVEHKSQARSILIQN